MKKYLTGFLFVLFSFLIYAQDIKVEKALVDIPPTSFRWGNDIVVLDAEPIGGMSGVQKSNGTIYVAINDTLTTPNLGIVIMTSTNRGDTWQMYPSGITLRDRVSKLKMIRSGADSIYCFFHYNTDVYCWNIAQPFLNAVLLGNYRTFDVTASSIGNLYLVLDSLPNNSLIRYGSTDGGSTWISRGNITSAGTFPTFNMSTSGDTLVLNYYGPVLVDTATSAIRNARYRETGPGTMATTGSFTDIVPAGETKLEFRSSFRNGEIFFAFSKGAAGSRDIYFRKSLDNGVSFSPEAPMISSATRDEFWFDIKSYFAGTGGFDIVYYSDSLAGAPTAGTDQLFFTGNSFGSTTVPIPGDQVNQYPLQWSANEYAPALVELYYSANDAGVLYVADVSATKKVLWDYLSNIIPVELTSFTAAYADGNVILNWSTASETNNNGFEVQRTDNGSSDWKALGFIQGNGTTTEKMSYSFADNNISAGSYSYRLKQIDMDGSFEYSNVVNIDVSTPDEFTLFQNYPNPFNPVTRIKYQIPENASGITTLKIYDLIGNEVAVLINEIKQAGSFEIDFDGTSLASGMYFYELRNGDFASVKKMILIK